MNFIEVPIITSKDNSRLKAARAVRDGRETDLIFVEGRRLVSELLKSDLGVRSLFVSEDASADVLAVLESVIQKTRAETFRIDSKIFRSIADTLNSQGIIALAERPKSAELRAWDGVAEALMIYLENCGNPTNLGAAIRSAEAAGVSAVALSPGSADPYSPKALRASMGSAFRMPVVRDIPVTAFAAFVRSVGMSTVGADLDATGNHTDFDWKVAAALVLGSEAHGLSREALNAVDYRVRIDMANDVESLNLAVSVGVLLFEAKRQRDGAP